MKITTSKSIKDNIFYKGSKQKDRILSAAQSPINTKLVFQLRSCLGDEYLDIISPSSTSPDSDADIVVDDSLKEGLDNLDIDMDNINDMLVSYPSDKPSRGHKPSGVHRPSGGDKLDEVDEPSPKPDEGPDSTSDEGSESVEESTQLPDGSSIEASTSVRPKLEYEVLIGTLNGRDDTTGAERAVVKDDELWIYYKDSINLNKVMTSVIELLFNEGYPIEFNRLARSDNAIVFMMNEGFSVSDYRPKNSGEE